MRFNVGYSPVLPPDHPAINGSTTPDACPVDDKTRSRWVSAATLASSSGGSTSAASSAGSGSKKSLTLSKEREISSIPRAPFGTTTVHMGSSEGAGNEDDQHWVYPSELQFFQAMSRKKHSPEERDMRQVVGIHNAVNEHSWNQVLLWEHGLGSEKCGGPRLVSFSGIPTKRSPKALLNMALGYSAPFDRHDWIIDRCGTQVRYVIDFYTGRQDEANPQKMAFFVDVRPALDTKVGLITRATGLWRHYIAGYGA